ncbi:rab GTPase-binding effector protein 1-like isoform X2 [Limulus polyphemus]|uniref:Rab GTPase-binding effector protein 1-like isoform X2 n=1 Tax=Limulus polyphemus TaxID=6850 RepID=A0ABM1SGN5_LIMPO|nr:rab GTPase-binding effector protein 1-like isoform X2 [Limulus polyphemus]
MDDTTKALKDGDCSIFDDPLTKSKALEVKVRQLLKELEETKSLLAVVECQKDNEIENEKQKCKEEIASLQEILTERSLICFLIEAVGDAATGSSNCYETEIARLQQINEKLDAELNEMKAREREGVLTSVAKSLKQRVGSISPHTFSTWNDNSENLEDSMKKAQEDSEILKSLVVPLEEEISILKEKLRYTSDQLKIYETAFSSLVNGLGSESLVDVMKDQNPVDVLGQLDEKLTSLNKGLQAEKSSRSDLEMYVAVLNTQKEVMQEDMDHVRKELQEVCQLLEQEKKEHAALKRTWQMANDQFLEAQRLQISDMRRMQSVLTAEQLRQVTELQRKDEERMEQEKKIARLQQMNVDPDKSSEEHLHQSSRSSPSPSATPRKSSPLVGHRRLKLAGTRSVDQVDSTTFCSDRTRSAPEDLSLTGLCGYQDKHLLNRKTKTACDTETSSLRRAISSSFLQECKQEKKRGSAETVSLLGFEEISDNSLNAQKLPSLTKDQLKALSDLTPEMEARKLLLDNARAEQETFSLVGKRLVSEKEWLLLEEEVKRAREKMGRSCEMCSNYELQLQQIQEADQKHRQQLADLQQTIDNLKEDLLREQAFRLDLEQKFNLAAEDVMKQVSELFKTFEDKEKYISELRSEYTSCYNDVYDKLKQLVTEREEMRTRLSKLYEENSSLLGKHIARAQQLQNEEINLPNTVEEMQFLYLKLQEDLITALIAKEKIEEGLKSEILFLRDEIMAEQNAKETMEDTLTQENDTLREQLTDLQRINSELELEKTKRREFEQKLKELESKFLESHEEQEKKVTETRMSLAEVSVLKTQLEEEVRHLKSKIQSLQTDLDNSEAVQRDFVKLSQSLQMELEKIRQSDNEVRWQHDDDVSFCNLCKKVFHYRKEKNHCNHCGKIFCVDCTSKIVYSGPKKRPFKVCSVCHTLLDHNTAPYFSNEPPHTPY